MISLMRVKIDFVTKSNCQIENISNAGKWKRALFRVDIHDSNIWLKLSRKHSSIRWRKSKHSENQVSQSRLAWWAADKRFRVHQKQTCTVLKFLPKGFPNISHVIKTASRIKTMSLTSPCLEGLSLMVGGLQIRAVLLITTAISSTNKPSGCFSSQGNSMTSTPILWSAPTNSSCSRRALSTSIDAPLSIKSNDDSLLNELAILLTRAKLKREVIPGCVAIFSGMFAEAEAMRIPSSFPIENEASEIPRGHYDSKKRAKSACATLFESLWKTGSRCRRCRN